MHWIICKGACTFIAIVCMLTCNEAVLKVLDTDPNSYSIVPDDGLPVIAFDIFNTTILVLTTANMFVYDVSPNKSPRNATYKEPLAKKIADSISLIGLKLLGEDYYVYCSNASITTSQCRLCSYVNSYCRLLLNKKEEAFTSATFSYIHSKAKEAKDKDIQKIIARFTDPKHAYFIVWDVGNTSTNLPAMQYTYDKETISQQVTVGSFVRGVYFWFVGLSMQKIDQLENIDPKSYAYTTNRLVVKITRVNSEDRREGLASRQDLTVDCRNDTRVPISAVSRVHYDSTKEELWFTIHTVDGDNQICKFNMATVHEKMDQIVGVCMKWSTSGFESDCKDLAEHYYPEHCYSMARNTTDGPWRTCASFDLARDGNWNFGWIEYFKPFWQEPVYSLFLDTVLPIQSDQSSAQFSYTNWKIPNVQTKADFDHILQIASTLGSSRNVAIFDKYVCYVDGTSVKIVPISCEAFYKMCDSVAKGNSSLSPPGCIWCPNQGYEVAMDEGVNSCKRQTTQSCTRTTKHSYLETETSTPKQTPGLASTVAFAKQSSTTNRAASTQNSVLGPSSTKSAIVGSELDTVLSKEGPPTSTLISAESPTKVNSANYLSDKNWKIMIILACIFIVIILFGVTIMKIRSSMPCPDSHGMELHTISNPIPYDY